MKSFISPLNQGHPSTIGLTDLRRNRVRGHLGASRTCRRPVNHGPDMRFQTCRRSLAGHIDPSRGEKGQGLDPLSGIFPRSRLGVLHHRIALRSLRPMAGFIPSLNQLDPGPVGLHHLLRNRVCRCPQGSRGKPEDPYPSPPDQGPLHEIPPCPRSAISHGLSRFRHSKPRSTCSRLNTTRSIADNATTCYLSREPLLVDAPLAHRDSPPSPSLQPREGCRSTRLRRTRPMLSMMRLVVSGRFMVYRWIPSTPQERRSMIWSVA